jgi:hypothetical protein
MPTPRLRVNCGARNAYASGAEGNADGAGAPAADGASGADDGEDEDAQQRRAAAGAVTADALARFDA